MIWYDNILERKTSEWIRASWPVFSFQGPLFSFCFIFQSFFILITLLQQLGSCIAQGRHDRSHCFQSLAQLQILDSWVRGVKDCIVKWTRFFVPFTLKQRDLRFLTTILGGGHSGPKSRLTAPNLSKSIITQNYQVTYICIEMVAVQLVSYDLIDHNLQRQITVENKLIMYIEWYLIEN